MYHPPKVAHRLKKQPKKPSSSKANDQVPLVVLEASPVLLVVVHHNMQKKNTRDRLW